MKTLTGAFQNLDWRITTDSKESPKLIHLLLSFHFETDTKAACSEF